jgi:N-acetylneuraminic acid mutarotase
VKSVFETTSRRYTLSSRELQLMRTGMLLLILICGPRTACGQITSIDDGLTVPNPQLWSEEGNEPGAGSVTYDARGLVLTLQPGVAARGIVSTCSLTGDFDVEVAITLIDWPANNLYGLRIGATDLGTGPFGEVGVYREGGGEFYTLAFASGSVHSPTVNADKVNKLRMKRQGGLLSGFFLANGGSTWVQIGGPTAFGATGTNPTRFNLDISASLGNPGGVTVAFNNFHVNSGTISCHPLPPVPRAWLGAATVGNVIYAIGGGTASNSASFGGNEVSTVEAYDTAANTWSPKASLQSARFGLTASTVNGQIYAIGGTSGSSTVPLGLVEQYDPGSDTWSSKNPMATPRWKLTSVEVSGKIYAIGGGATGNQCGATGIVEAYDPLTNAWSTKTSMPTPRWGAASIVISNLIYVVGGSQACPQISVNPSSALEVYDPVMDTWTAEMPMPRARWDLAVAAANGKIFAIGGWDPQGQTVLSTVEQFDPASNTWTTKAPLPTARSGLVALTVNGKIYAFGGSDNSQVLAILEVYDPLTDAWAAVPPSGVSPLPMITSVSPPSGPQGQTIPNFAVYGSNFDSTALLSFSGSDIKVNSVAPTPTQIVASITIAAGASPSAHDVIVTNANGQQAIAKGVFTVSELVPSVPQPDIGVSPTPLDCGTVAVRASVTKGLFVQNTGTARLLVTNISSSDRSFSINPNRFALDPGQAFTVSVRFSPVRAGAVAGILTITSNAPTTNVFVPVQGIGGHVSPLIPIPSTDLAPNHPLYISGSNVRPAGDKVIADVTVTNVTGTWYELDLDSSTPSAGASFPIPTQNMPFAFLIGPFQSVTFKDIMFPVGEYLQFDAASDSLAATAMFGIDFIARGIFGVELNSTLGVFKLSSAIFSAFVSTIQQNCAGPALAIGISLTPWSFIEKTAVFMQCTVSNPQVRKAVESLVTKLYGNQTATNYIKIGAGSLQGIIFAFTRIPAVVALAEDELTANHRGFVRLELPKPK